MAELKCIVVTPERTVCEEPADFVALTLFDGEIGIARAHTPLIGRLGCGEMRIQCGGRTTRYYVEGGFAEVLGNVVTVLTNRAVSAEKLDEAAAREQLATARTQMANTPELMAARDRAIELSRAQLRVAKRIS
ncbi:MAG: ATP synthase F1 subunit epsilon [Pirellulales bacterium]|nr:ATP synthase F1 subunit epsilon [Pirellulales bacterium]